MRIEIKDCIKVQGLKAEIENLAVAWRDSSGNGNHMLWPVNGVPNGEGAGEMTSAVVSAEKFAPVPLQELSEGEYRGTWGGYEATAVIGSQQHRFRTASGIRAMNVPCVIRVKSGTVTVKTF